MRKVLFLSLLLIAVTGLANADTIMYTFSWSGGNQGQITNNGLNGSGIGIDSLEVVDMTAGTDNTYVITGGALSFDLGALWVKITGNAGAFGSGTLLSGSLDASGGATRTGCSSADLSCDVTFDNGTSNLGSFDPGMGGGYAKGSSLVAGGPWDAKSNSFETTLTTTPEPASLVLLASGLALMGGSLRRKLIK